MAPLETPISSCSFRMMGTTEKYDHTAEDLLGVKQSKALVLGLSWWDRKEGRWIEPSCKQGSEGGSEAGEPPVHREGQGEPEISIRRMQPGLLDPRGDLASLEVQGGCGRWSVGSLLPLHADQRKK